ncbi:MAG: peptidoglycan DD-metalloendopeptidase family protein [Anaerolineales bacterium]|nr:peptidoglycan DD-metalloendopeptidase family protein [Anaerolineales bacterium]
MIHTATLITVASLLPFYLFLRPIGEIAVPDEQSLAPYYVVQEGDTLWDISLRFGVLAEDLQSLNEISDPNLLNQGTQLLIPGLNGVSGRVATVNVPVGESLQSFSRQFHLPTEQLAQINQLVSPGQLFAGRSLVVPVESVDNQLLERTRLAAGQSHLELAVKLRTNPWRLIQSNSLPGSWGALPGEMLVLPEGKRFFVDPIVQTIKTINLEPLNPIQGKTTSILVSAPPDLVLRGSLAGYEFNFFPYQDGYVALQGIHAMTLPGLFLLRMEIESPSGEKHAISQPVLVRSGNYPFDPPLLVDAATMDPNVTIPEDELWASLALPVSPEKKWQGLFESPVPVYLKDCWTSLFGSRRSYNGSPYNFYHGGLDFCGTSGTPLYASADGEVVFTDFLIVRGGVTVLDHGWGVFTAYAHQSEILVQVGDQVEVGQIIGLGGDTGRSTGPHLHWEVWVGGVPVDPVDWLNNIFP